MSCLQELTTKTLEELFDVMGTDVEDLSATVVDEGDWKE